MTTLIKTRSCLSAREVVDKLQEIKDIDFNIDLTRDKNTETLIKYNLTHQDVVDIIKELKIKNYKNTLPCENPKYKTDYLYEFHISMQLTDEFGEIRIVLLYIKVGFHNSKCLVYVVSFHEDD